ncbi:DNA-binding protein, partial [Yersinia enterocolitica]
MIWITLNELLSVNGLPKTPQGLGKKAKNEGWTRRKLTGVKGLSYEYLVESLPADVQNIINERHLNSLLNAEKKAVKTAFNGDVNPRVKAKHELDLMRQCPALLERSTGNLTKLQRDIADARATL